MPIFTKKLFAEDYVVSSSVVSMSIAQASGSTIFGDTADDTHLFIGNTISGSATSTASFGKYENIVSFAGADGTEPLFSGSAASTGSFGSLSVRKTGRIFERDASGNNGPDLIIQTSGSKSEGNSNVTFRTGYPTVGLRDVMTVDYTGAVIIGAGGTVPADNHTGGGGSLTVFNTGTSILKIANNTTGQDANSGTDLQLTSGTSEFLIINRDATDIKLKSNSNEFRLNASTNAWSGSATSTGSFGKLQINGKDIFGDSDGIGLGTSNPSAQLHLFRDDSTTDTTNGLLIEQDGTGDAVVQFLLTGTKRYIMGIDNSDSDAFKITPGVSDISSGTTTFRYGSTGRLSLRGTDARLAVGTDPSLQFHVEGYGQLSNRLRVGHTTSTIPDAMLDVHGDAIITGSLTTEGNVSGSSTSTGSFGTVEASHFTGDGAGLTNVPDYVFESEYVLRSLSDVEEFVSESKHLPGIPSMDDMSEWKKYSVGDRDMLLLEKIEELTLYVIRLEKRIKDLENN